MNRLRSHNLAISCGIYAEAEHAGPGRERHAGDHQPERRPRHGLIEIMYGGTGFMHVRREVYETIQRQLALPVCNTKFAGGSVPYFQPMVREFEEGRALVLGGRFLLLRTCPAMRLQDHRRRLHPPLAPWTAYAYGWEDAGLPWPALQVVQVGNRPAW